MSKISYEKEITTDTKEMQEIIKDCYEKFYANKLGNLEEMDKFLEIYSFSKLNQEEIENLNRPITRNEIESVIKKLPMWGRKQDGGGVAD